MSLSVKPQVEFFSDHRLQTQCSVLCLDRKAIFALGDEWERLSRNAVEENPYYGPVFMRAMLENIEKNQEIKALAVYKDATLVGFLPFIIDPWRWLRASAISRAWITPYSTLTIPLVDNQCGREVVEALVWAMDEHSAAGSFWLFDNFNLEGPVAVLFDEVLRDKNLASKIFDEFDRPSLLQGATFDQHMLAQVSKKRRSSLKRNRKRLMEKGRVEMRFFTSGPGLETVVEDFLKMESAGWKGQRGTALASNASTAAFARSVFGDAGGNSITRAEVLYLDEKPIAVSLSISVGKIAFTLKCTYDEAYRPYSPGLLLEQDIIKDFLETRWAERLDSAITTTGHVLQALWKDSIRVGDVLMCADNTKSADSFDNYARLEKLRRLCRRKLKSIVARSRGEAV
jgi:Acetyltransferase (GNAT) domain